MLTYFQKDHIRVGNNRKIINLRVVSSVGIYTNQYVWNEKEDRTPENQSVKKSEQKPEEEWMSSQNMLKKDWIKRKPSSS